MPKFFVKNSQIENDKQGKGDKKMKKIIIVDDSAVLRVSIKQALESFN